MTRGRHRQSSPAATTLPLAAVGALVVCSAALAIFGGDTRLLRLGVSCSLAAAVAVAVLLRARERALARELATSASARRVEAAQFHEQMRTLRGTVDKLTAEVVSLREELVEVTAAHSAAMLVSTAPVRPMALNRDAFLQAAAALGADREQTMDPVPGDRSVRALRPVPAERAGLAFTGLSPVQSPSFEWFSANGPADPVATESVAEPVAASAAASAAASVAEPARDAALEEPSVPAERAEPAEQVDEPGEVIDLTAHDDTQPLRLSPVRKRA